MADKRYKVAVIPGDGIGQEVIPAAVTVLEAVAARGGFSLELKDFPWGCAYYTKHGRMMAADAYDQLAEFPVIYFGAVGDPSVPDHIAVWELILPLRQRFDQYVNLRPMRLLPGVTSPLANRAPADIDMVCVRENSEGEYAGIGGRILTELGAAVSGSLGMAPSGNINPERKHPSMFEPIHGSAPDIKGKGIANPIGAIWAGALMFDHLGERAAHDAIVTAIIKVLSSGDTKTPDLGGKATTKEMAAAIRTAI